MAEVVTDEVGGLGDGPGKEGCAVGNLHCHELIVSIAENFEVAIER